MMRLSVVTLSLLAASTAAAEPTLSQPTQTTATYDMGFRVGGYGFKREGDSRPGTGWSECRMNGVGVFASRVLHGPLFVEAGLDLYTSADFPLPANSMDLPIDRMSGLVGVSVGARTQLSSHLRGFLQLGGALELTRVAVPYGENETIRDTKTMPAGFLGVGLDIKLGGKTYLGATFRTLMMGNFNYSRSELDQRDDWGFIAPDKSVVFDASIDFAAQGQFFLRRDL